MGWQAVFIPSPGAGIVLTSRGTIKIAFCAATFHAKLCKLFRSVLLTNFFFARFVGPMVLVRSRSVAYLSLKQVREAIGQEAWTSQIPWYH